MAISNSNIRYEIYKSTYEKAYNSLPKSPPGSVDFRTILAKRYVQIPSNLKTDDAGKWIGDVWQHHEFKFVCAGDKWDIDSLVTVIPDLPIAEN